MSADVASQLSKLSLSSCFSASCLPLGHNATGYRGPPPTQVAAPSRPPRPPEKQLQKPTNFSLQMQTLKQKTSNQIPAAASMQQGPPGCVAAAGGPRSSLRAAVCMCCRLAAESREARIELPLKTTTLVPKGGL